MLGFLSNLVASIVKSAENAKNKLIRKHKEKVKAGTATPEEEKSANRSESKVASKVAGIGASIAGFMESIPIVNVVILIVSLLIVVSIVVCLVVALINSLSSSVIDVTAAMSGAFDWENEYTAVSKSQVKTLEGDYITYLIKSKSGTTNPDKPNPDQPADVEVITDIEFWKNLNDDEIAAFLDSQEIPNANTRIKMENLMRAIRMAYRVCYATKSDNNTPDDITDDEYYVTGFSPDMLIGMMCTEKGYNWLQLQGARSEARKDTGWFYLNEDRTDWEAEPYVFSDGDTYDTYRYKVNVDCCVNTLFDPTAMSGAMSDYKINNWSDGPFSFTEYKLTSNTYDAFDTAFNNYFADDGPLHDMYLQLCSYPEYAWLAQVPRNGIDGTSGATSRMIQSLLPSMMLTVAPYNEVFFDKAANYDEETGIASPLANTANVAYGEYSHDLCYSRYFDIDGSKAFSDFKASSGVTIDTWDEDVLGVLLAYANGYSSTSEVTKPERESCARGLAQMLYYASIHHIPNIHYLYEDLYNFNTIKPADYPTVYVSDTDYSDFDDFYFSMIYMNFLLWDYVDGNLSMYNIAEVVDHYGKLIESDSDTDTDTDTDVKKYEEWTPLGKVDMTNYKFAFTSNYWCSLADVEYFYGYYVDDSTAISMSSGWADIMGNENGDAGDYDGTNLSFIGLISPTETLSEVGLNIDNYKLSVGTTGTNATHTPLEYCGMYTVITSPKNSKFTESMAEDYLQGLCFASVSPGGTTNMHALPCEGITSITLGGDVISQYLNSVLVWQDKDIISDGPINAGDLVILEDTPYYTTFKASELFPYDYRAYKTPGKYKDIETGNSGNVFLPFADVDLDIDGIQAWKGSDFAHISHGLGYYSNNTAGNAHHGVDFCAQKPSIGKYVGAQYIFDRTFTAGYYTECANRSKPVIAPLVDLVKHEYTVPSGSHSLDFYHRQPIISVADGYLYKLTWGCVADYAEGSRTSLGNCIMIASDFVSYDETGKARVTTYYAAYGHMCLDLLSWWDAKTGYELLPNILGTDASGKYSDSTLAGRLKTGAKCTDLSKSKNGTSYIMTKYDIKVQAGEILGFQGETGAAMGDHLHLCFQNESSDSWCWDKAVYASLFGMGKQSGTSYYYFSSDQSAANSDWYSVNEMLNDILSMLTSK